MGVEISSRSEVIISTVGQTLKVRQSKYKDYKKLASEGIVVCFAGRPAGRMTAAE